MNKTNGIKEVNKKETIENKKKGNNVKKFT